MVVLLVVAHSKEARIAVRNAVNAHEEAVHRRFGRAVLLRETVFGAFLACRLRAEYGTAIQVERTRPFVAEELVSDTVREAALAYAERESRTTPYRAFAAGTDHPSPDAMKDAEL